MWGRFVAGMTRLEDGVKQPRGRGSRTAVRGCLRTTVVLLVFALTAAAEEPKERSDIWSTPNDSCTVRIRGRVIKEKPEDKDTCKCGVGFFVDDKGNVVTAKHVIERMEGVEIKRVGVPDAGAPDSAVFVDSSQHHDIALLKLKSSCFPPYLCHPVTFADETSPIVSGTHIEIRGWSPRDKNLLITGQLDSIDVEQGLTLNGIQIREIPGPKGRAIPWGCSGSPIFGRGTNVVVGCLTTMITEEYIYDHGKYGLKYTYKPLPKDYRGAYVKQIKLLLSENNVPFEVTHFDPQAAPELNGNPVPKGEERSWFVGMLELILFSIQDLVQAYDQFEDKDTDILIETFLQTSSFMRKISKSDYPLTDPRQKAVFYFIKGLAMKASRRHAFPASRQYFERAVYEDSSFADPRYQLARYHLMCTGDSASAIGHLRRALELDPEDGEALRVLGLYYMLYPEEDSAKTYIERAAAYLPPDDPRIPFYLGLLHDPYWSIVKSMNSWQSDFRQSHGREPGITEVLRKRKELLEGIPRRDDSLKVAMKYYKESMLRNPGYIRPLNAVVWALANEALEDSSSDSLWHAELLGHLSRMSTFVGYGLVDPRSFNTLALGFCAINDCEIACEYWIRSMKGALRDIQLSPGYINDLKRENERVTSMCSCGYKLFQETSSK